MEQNNELTKISTLENKLSVELSKIEELQPIYPIDEEKVRLIDTSENNNDIILAAYNYPRVHQYPTLALKYRMLIAINKTRHNRRCSLFQLASPA